MLPKPPLRASAIAHWDAGRLKQAQADAWTLLDAAPGEIANKALLVDLLSAAPSHASSDRAADLLRLIRDPNINPAAIARAGWHVVTTGSPFAAAGPDMAALVTETECSLLVRALLEEAPVTMLTVEQTLTRLRRWLLLDDRWRSFPATLKALAAQARHNGGAWLFDAEERGRVAGKPGTPIAETYCPSPLALRPGATTADVTDAVAAQYEAWPYPQWTRVTRRVPKQLAEVIRAFDPNGPETIPAVPAILIAGSGTGREIAFHRVRYPNAKITAIDVSRESLRYAADRLAQSGLGGAELIQHDLRDVAALQRRFDFVSCIGVLHHLADPEGGWAALTEVLNPGGVMHVMLYSAAARLRVQAMRTEFADLLRRPMSDDLLREARHRAIARNARGIVGSTDFFTLAGVHDLLLHRYEDSFDVQRIGRVLDALDLELLAFGLPNRRRRARYRTEHPHDPLFRDRTAWQALEKAEPTLFSGMYELWCRKRIPAAR